MVLFNKHKLTSGSYKWDDHVLLYTEKIKLNHVFLKTAILSNGRHIGNYIF